MPPDQFILEFNCLSGGKTGAAQLHLKGVDSDPVGPDVALSDADVECGEDRVTHLGRAHRRAALLADQVGGAQPLGKDLFHRLLQPRRLVARVEAVAQRHGEAEDAGEKVDLLT